MKIKYTRIHQRIYETDPTASRVTLWFVISAKNFKICKKFPKSNQTEFYDFFPIYLEVNKNLKSKWNSLSFKEQYVNNLP